MAHQVSITYRGTLGEDLADRLMNALQERADDMGPTIGEDLADGTFTIVLAVSAPDLQRALAVASYATDDAMGTARLPHSPIGAEVELVDEHAPAAA